MTEKNTKQYDLEERTFQHAKKIIKFTETLPKTLANIEISKQLIRSGSSIGANYIEANESLSRKDFIMRIKICRKESKESIYWLKLIDVSGENHEHQRQQLIQESKELTRIFGAILEKTK